ncbi:hypothetical protein E2K98_28605 [Bacillus salipaludis]|uniref:Uncharacterized protein n=1 Tax=Bacillus salipaludis TaxID=2547811 RepID=A0A4R5VJV5_9BACI|nr:hypothetical protein [Bacillus salipaludis]TDK55331.1 hypothetical protein E2K98_28605 [Bacillus salipaludis]
MLDDKSPLSASEIGMLWLTYMEKTMILSNGFKQKRSQALNYLITPIEKSITTYQNIATLIRNHITH